MHIIHATDPITVDHPVFLIVAPVGLGKSSLGYSSNNLLLDFDRGAHRVTHRGATARLDTWADVDMTRAAYANYAGVTVDTVERALGLLTLALLEEHANYGSNGKLNQKGWGELKRRFGIMLDTWRSFALDVCLLAHAKDVRIGDRYEVRADIQGGSYNEVLKRADCIGYLSMVGGRRVLDFNPTDQFAGKNPGGWPQIIVPPAAQAATFLAELFDEARTTLGKRSEASARIAAAVQVWQTTIAGYRTVEQFRLGLAAVRAIKADTPVYTQAHHLLNAAMKAAGMRYDGASGAIVDTGVRPPVAPIAAAVRRAATVQAPLAWAAAAEVA